MSVRENTSEKGQLTLILLLVPHQTPSDPSKESVILIKAASQSLLHCYGWVVLLLCGYATLVYSSVDRYACSFYFWLSWPVLLWRFTYRLSLLPHSPGCTEVESLGLSILCKGTTRWHSKVAHCVLLFTLALELCSGFVHLTHLW